MSDTYEIEKQSAYLLIAASAFISILFLILGIIIGRTMQGPEPVPSMEQLAGQVKITNDQTELPEIIEGLPRVTDESSSQPHIPQEGMTFYEKLGRKSSPVPTAGKSTPEPELITTTEMVSHTEKLVIPPTEKPGMTPVASGSGWAVQVSALSNMADAETLVQKLKGQGYPAYVSSKKFKNNTISYRVRVGPFATKSQADQMAAQIERTERRSTWVDQETGDE